MTEDISLIIGAGPIGTAVAQRLSDQGRRVRVATRSGRGPILPGVELVAVDAADAHPLTAVARGATTIYNCANPGSYPAWEREWPPLAASILNTAENVGAGLVIMGNLYAYGPVDGEMGRQTPLRPSDHKGELRKRMWEDALAAYDSGRVRATEVRAADYLGPTAPTSSSILAMYAAATLRGRTATVFTDVDQPHAWTALDDIAATLVAAGQSEEAWGSAWIVPSHQPHTIREVLRAMGEAVGAGEPRLRRLPEWMLRFGAAVVPIMREVGGIAYQFNRPFLVDASETTTVLGVNAGPWDDLITQTATAWHARPR